MRPRRDFDDDDLFDREEADRRRTARAAMVAAGEERARQTAEQDAAMAARTRDFTRRANGEALLKEYRGAGVAPLQVDGDGYPTTSLALLRKMGWRVEELEQGTKALIAPPPLPRYEPPRDNDSLPTRKKKR